MAIRFDASTSLNVYKTDDGRMFCKGAFCRDGILKYQQPDGSTIYELRRPEANQSSETLKSFKGLPMVIEHPPCGLLNSSNYRQYTIGTSLDSDTRYDADFGGIVGACTIFDSEAIKYAESGEKVQLSAGYVCDLINKPGEWNGQKYDREQINVRANHLALTGKGRAGADVCLRLDADEDIGIVYEIERMNMGTANIRIDGIEWQIPDNVAPVLGSKLSELSTLQAKYDSVESKFSDLLEKVKTLQDELQTAQGRTDAFETIVGNADYVLGELGYQRSLNGTYERSGNFREDSYSDEDDEYEEEEENEEEDEDESEDEYYLDPEEYAEELLETWEKTDSFLPGFKKAYFDSSYSPVEIKMMAIREIYPEISPNSLANAGEAYIDGFYEKLVEAASEEGEEKEEDNEEEEGKSENRRRADSVYDLTYAMQNTQDYRNKPLQFPVLNENYKKPLTIS